MLINIFARCQTRLRAVDSAKRNCFAITRRRVTFTEKLQFNDIRIQPTSTVRITYVF